jgi:hypothetical protein
VEREHKKEIHKQRKLNKLINDQIKRAGKSIKGKNKQPEMKEENRNK